MPLMLTPDEFRHAFADDDMVLFDRAAAEAAGLAAGDVHWLSTVGLPSQAAPFLDFGSDETRRLPTVDDYFRLRGEVPPRYRVIGGNGAGDPIVIDAAGAGRILSLSHDDRFRPVFMNSSLPHLAGCLVAYKTLVAETRAANGASAFLNGDVPPAAVERFASAVRTLDPPAAAAGSMWSDEIASLGEAPPTE